MATFTDAGGKEHALRIRSIGHLEDMSERHGVAVDTAFMDGTELGGLLYGSPRRMAAILADLAGLEAEAATAFVRAMDRPALDRGRVALLAAAAEFCLPEAAQKKFADGVPDLLAKLAGGGSDGSSRGTNSPA